MAPCRGSPSLRPSKTAYLLSVSRLRHTREVGDQWPKRPRSTGGASDSAWLGRRLPVLRCRSTVLASERDRTRAVLEGFEILDSIAGPPVARALIDGKESHAVLAPIYPSGTKTRSCRPHVLVDEATEEISPFDVGHAVGLFDGGETLGYLQLQSWVRASPVVVLHIDPEDAIEAAGAEDQQPVQGTARSVSLQLGEGVRVRRPDRRAGHPDPFGYDDIIEGAGDLSRSRMRKPICVPFSAWLIARFLA